MLLQQLTVLARQRSEDSGQGKTLPPPPPSPGMPILSKTRNTRTRFAIGEPFEFLTVFHTGNIIRQNNK